MNCVFTTIQKFSSYVSKNCGDNSLVKIYTFVPLRGYKKPNGLHMKLVKLVALRVSFCTEVTMCAVNCKVTSTGTQY